MWETLPLKLRSFEKEQNLNWIRDLRSQIQASESTQLVRHGCFSSIFLLQLWRPIEINTHKHRWPEGWLSLSMIGDDHFSNRRDRAEIYSVLTNMKWLLESQHDWRQNLFKVLRSSWVYFYCSVTSLWTHDNLLSFASI